MTVFSIRKVLRELEDLKQQVVFQAREMGHHVTVNGHVLDEKLKRKPKRDFQRVH